MWIDVKMSILIFYFLSLFCYICGAKSNPSSIIVPCKINDEECMKKSANIAIRLLGKGVPSMGIESIDPIRIDLLKIKVPSLQLTLKDTITNGFSKCVAQNVTLNMDSLKLKFDLNCPLFEMIGHYELSGSLLSLPIEGKGPCTITTGAHVISVDADLERITGDDGNTFLAIKQSKQIGVPVAPVKFQFDNLFNGQKELSDATHAALNENYKEVVTLLEGPILNFNVNFLTKQTNRLLKTTPIDNLFIN